MQLTIEGINYAFVPIKSFREVHTLPSEFGVALFEPKDYSDLGRIDKAGTALNSVRHAVLDAAAVQLSPAQWLTHLPTLINIFETQLESINHQVGLKQVEIEYAVSGFSDGLQAYIFALLKSQNTGTANPPFQLVYHDWLNSTVRVYAQKHTCTLDDELATVQLVAHVYGRIGLLIHTTATTYAIYDPALACPAEGFMTTLLTDVATIMVNN